MAEPSLSPDLVTTPAAKALLQRPVFPAIGSRPRPLGGHIAVNGYDLALVEEQAFARGVASSMGRLPSTASREEGERP